MNYYFLSKIKNLIKKVNSLVTVLINAIVTLEKIYNICENSLYSIEDRHKVFNEQHLLRNISDAKSKITNIQAIDHNDVLYNTNVRIFTAAQKSSMNINNWWGDCKHRDVLHIETRLNVRR